MRSTRSLATALRQRLGRTAAWAVGTVASLPARRAIAPLRFEPGAGVCYASSLFPAPPASRAEMALGGAVKMTYLSEHFPHRHPVASALYLVSSVFNPWTLDLARRARDAGMRVVLNQNGVYYAAWHGSGWERENRPLAELHALADRVVYQSEFCRESASRFLGPTTAPASVLFNPVDLRHYRPATAGARSPGPLRLLTIAAPEHFAYRIRAAIDTLAALPGHLADSELVVPGYDPRKRHGRRMMGLIAGWATQSGIATERIHFPGAFTRADAPDIFSSGDILLHTCYNDPSPNVISEALAVGLPVAYSASGGVPELVGPRAGIGVPAPHSWERIHPPEPGALAGAVEEIVANLDEYRAAARQRAEAAFSLQAYVSAHEEIFGEPGRARGHDAPNATPRARAPRSSLRADAARRHG